MRKRPLEERFWEKVDIGSEDECWEWQAYLTPDGYGRIWFQGQQLYVHRVAWALLRGEIPEGVCVLHHCDVRSCVNPEHLWLGSRAENNRDRDSKGRGNYPGKRGEENGNSKLTTRQVLEIRGEYETASNTLRGLAAQYGVSHGCINSIIQRRKWKHV